MTESVRMGHPSIGKIGVELDGLCRCRRPRYNTQSIHDGPQA